MKKRLLSLVLWTLVFYYVFSPIRQWAETGDFIHMYDWALDKEELILLITTLISFFCYSLGAYLVLFATYLKKRYGLMVVLLILCIPAAIAFRYVLQEIVMKAIWGFSNYTEGYPLDTYFFDNLYYAFVFMSFGISVFFVQYGRYQEQQRLDYEIETKKTQLALLRSQLNPHFLFNALNNIYALVYEKSDTSLRAIEKLSSLLRYSLYEKAETVPLAKEWQFIEDYIELETMRLPFTPAILLDVPPELPRVAIPPFSLITFVENAFKHGDLQNTEHPLRIQIKLEDERIHFNIQNRIVAKEKDQQGGIGLENLKRRLAIFYQNQHLLKIEKDRDSFLVNFKIPATVC